MAFRIRKPSQESFFALNAIPLYSYAIPLGSPDNFNHHGRRAYACVNFITAHDGFTLNDVVTYNEKHNEANGEDNRDGSSNNHSWNCGIEGPTDDPAINQ